MVDKTPASKIMGGLIEARSVATGEAPAARIHVNGHAYVPEATHQRALEALREAREALRAFAAFSEKAERFVEHKAKFGGTAIFPVKDFRLSHFRRAVEVVALIDTLRPGDAP